MSMMYMSLLHVSLLYVTWLYVTFAANVIAAYVNAAVGALAAVCASAGVHTNVATCAPDLWHVTYGM